MMKFLTLLISVLLSISFSVETGGQTKKNTNINLTERGNIRLTELQTSFINKVYYKTIATPKDIINGKEVLPYSFRSQTTPFFFSREKLNASLNANSRKYKNIKLQYDTFQDELIYTDTSRIVNSEFPRIALNKDIIESFTLYINGNIYNFKHIRFPGSHDKRLQDGFYEVVYEGSLLFIIKHRSSLYNKEGLNEYKYSPERFILIGDKSYKITNKKNLLLIFKDHAQEIKDYLHKSRIKVKKATKEEIVAIINYYDTLKPAERLTK
jgi:hypothetical protein